MLHLIVFLERSPPGGWSHLLQCRWVVVQACSELSLWDVPTQAPDHPSSWTLGRIPGHLAPRASFPGLLPCFESSHTLPLGGFLRKECMGSKILISGKSKCCYFSSTFFKILTVCRITSFRIVKAFCFSVWLQKTDVILLYIPFYVIYTCSTLEILEDKFLYPSCCKIHDALPRCFPSFLRHSLPPLLSFFHHAWLW